MTVFYGPDKTHCHYLLNKAIKQGEVVKPTSCSFCGRSISIEGHHEDYSKPLDVVWLCKKCHRARHSNQPTEPPVNENCLRMNKEEFLSLYKNCTYRKQKDFDLTRNCWKYQFIVTDNRGYIMYKEVYYKT